jgi:YD repeat-containing protein
VENEAFDFKGNLLSSRRQLAVDYKTVLNWKGRPRLLTKTYASSHRYDALNRPVSVTTPDGSVLKPRFNRAGLLQSLAVQLRGAATETRFVEAVDYDAKGRRTRIAYGNGVASLYRHDPLTQRMSRHQTLRGTTPCRT